MPEDRIQELKSTGHLKLIKGGDEVPDSLVCEASESPEVLERLCDCYVPRIYNYILKRVGKVHDAEDITSMVFEKVISNINSYDPKRASFATWIYKIATNCLTDFYRSKGRKKETFLEDEGRGDYFSEDMATERVERYMLLIGLLDSLSPKYRDAVALRYFAGMRVFEVAETLDITESAASKRIVRGLEELKRLAAEGQQTM